MYTQLSRCGDTAFDRFFRKSLPGGGEKSLALDFAFCAGMAFSVGTEFGAVDDELDGCCDSVGGASDVAFMPTFLPRLHSSSFPHLSSSLSSKRESRLRVRGLEPRGPDPETGPVPLAATAASRCRTS